MHPKALVHHQEGLAFQEQGNLTAARDAYLQALELDARLDQTRLNLAEVLTQLGDVEGATRECRTLLDFQPNNLKAAYLLGVLLAKVNRLSEAIASFQQALSVDNDFMPALRALVAIFHEQGDAANEGAMLVRVVALAPQDAPARFALAECLVRTGRTAEAVQPLREALALEPSSISGYLLLADVEGRLGHGEEAWQVLQSIAGRAPQAPGLREALLALCRAQATDAGMTGRPDLSSQWWERLIAIAPDDSEALGRLERLYTTQSRMGDLVRLLEGFAARHPGDAASVLRLADATLALGRKQDALSIYKQALAQAPDDAALRAKAVELAMELNLPQEARALMLTGSSASSLSGAERLRLARAKALEGQKEEAWSLIEGLLDDPEQAEAARTLGRNLATRQAEDYSENPIQGIRWWERVLVCTPLSESATRALAICYRQVNRGADAVRVLSSLPTRYKDPEILRELAAACDAADMFDVGHEAYTALLAREGSTTEGVLHLIELSLGAGKLQRAWEECAQLQRLDPNYPKLRPTQAKVTEALAEAEEKAGNYAGAVEWWSKHITFNTDSPGRKRLALAQIAIGNLNAAVLTYRSWFRRHPTDIEVALWLGGNELEEGLFSEAREYFEAVLELRPNNLEALHGLAKVAASEGSDDEALVLFGRILALEKDHLPAAIAMARQAIQKRDDEGAWDLLKRVLAQNPEHAEAKSLALPTLKRIAASYFDDLALGWWDQVLAIAPDDPDALKAIAKHTAKRSDAAPAEVTKAFQEVLAADPEDVEARVFLAQQAFERGEIAEMKRLLGTKGVLQHPAGVILAASLALTEGDYSRARNLYGMILKERPGDPAALQGQAELAIAEKDYVQAWSLIRGLPFEVAASPKVQTMASNVARRLAETATGPAAIPIFEELLKLEPRDLEARFALCEIYLEDGNAMQAVLYLQQILAIDSKNERAALMGADLLAQGRQYAEAIKWLDPLVEAGNLGASVKVGQLHQLLGNRAQARAAYERVIEVSPVHVGAHKALAVLAAEEADGEGAWRHLSAFLKADPDNRAGRIEAYRTLQELARRLDPAEALGWWQRVVDFDPDDPELQVTYASLLRATGQAGKAAEALERVLERAPFHLDLAVELGEYYLAEGRLDKARTAYGIAAQGGDLTALKALGSISRREGDLPQAAAWLSKAVAGLAEDPSLHLELAEVLFEAGDPRSAREAVAKVIELQPDHPRARSLQALVWREVARSSTGAEALACWKGLSEANPEDLEAHRELMRAATQLGLEAESQLALERIVAIDPSDGMSALNLGIQHHAQGRLDAARPLLERAYEQGYPEAAYYLAEVAFGTGDLALAEARLSEAMQRQPGDPNALRLRYAIARQKGDADDEWAALADLAAVSSDPQLREQQLALVRRQVDELGAEAAIAWIERGFALRPTPQELMPRAVTVLGKHYLEQGQSDQAREALLWAAEAHEEPAMLALARLARAERDHAAAAGWFVRALEKNPADEAIPLELVETLLQDSALTEAYDLLVNYRREHPEQPRAMALLVTCLARLALETKGPEALHWHKELVRLRPEEISSWRAIAEIALELGRQADREEALERLVFLDPDDVRGAAALARRYFEQGRFEESGILFERGAKDGDVQAMRAAAEAYAHARQPEAADAWLESYLEKVPEAAGSVEMLRLRFMLARDRGDAEAAWQALDVLEPLLATEDAATLRMVREGLCWSQLEAGADFERWLERSLQLASSEEDLPAVAHTALGHRHMATGRLDEARSCFATAASREEPQAMVALARLERDHGSLAEALVWYQKAGRWLGRDPEVVVEHAELLARMGHLLQAVALLDELLAVEPNVVAAVMLEVEIVRSLAYEASDEEALKWWRKLASLASDDSEALRKIVWLSTQLDRPEDAVEALETLVESDDGDAVSVLALAQQRLSEGKREQARPLLERAAESGLTQAYLPLAELCLEASEYALAHRYLEAQAEVAAEDPRLWRLRRALARAEGEPEAEWEAMQALARLAPDADLAKSQLALCLSRLGLETPQGALVWIDRAIGLHPRDPRFAMLKAECLLRLGRTADAEASFAEAHRLGETGARVCQVLLEAAERDCRHADAYDWCRRLLAATGESEALRARALAHARAAASMTSAAERARWNGHVLELAPEDTEALTGLMAHHRSHGALLEAAACAHRLLAIRPGDLDAMSVMAEAATLDGRSDEARRSLQQLLTAHPDHLSSLLALARLERQEGNLEGAWQLFKRALTLRPNDPDALRELADVLRQQGRLDAALQLLEQDAGAHVELSRLSASVAQELAAKAANAGKPGEALAWYQRALAHDPASPAALRALADHSLTSGRNDEALGYLFALAKHSSAPEDLQKLAEALLSAQRKVEAKAILQSLARDFDHLSSWEHLGELALDEGDLVEAAEAARRLSELGAPSAGAFARRLAVRLARSLDPAQQAQESLQAWQDVLAVAPEDLEAQFGVARACAAMGELQEAISRLEALLASDATFSDAKALLAECHLLSGDQSRAEALFQEVLESDPFQPVALMALARSAQTRGEFVLAGEYCQRVLSVGPTPERDRARVLAAYCARQLAEAARLRRDFDQAFLYADLLVAYQPQTLDLLRFLSELARDAGRLEIAAGRYRRLLLAYPDSLEEGIQLARCFADANEARRVLTELWDEHQPLAAAHALAVLASDADEASEAIGWWQRALEQAPVHPLLLRRLADLCRREDRHAEACDLYRRLAEATSFEPTLLKTWGSTAMAGELYSVAREPYERLAKDHGDRTAALTLAVIGSKLGEYEMSWDWAQRVLETDSDAEAETLAMEAARHLSEECREPEQALTWRERYLAFAPGDVEAWVAMGREQAQVGRFDEALDTFAHAMELAPGEPAAGFERGETLRRLGRLEEAQEAFQAVLSEVPSHAGSLFALSEMAWEAGDVQSVWQLGQQLLYVDGENPVAIALVTRCARQLAREATDSGDYESAILYWELLLTYSPHEVEALRDLGEAYVQAGRLAEAVGIQRELVKLLPDEIAHQFRHGEIAAMGGFWEEARTCFEELRELDPTSLATHQALAIVALGLEEPLAAVDHYRAALSVAPDDLISLFGLGRILYSEGELAEAFDPLRRAAQLSVSESDHAEYLALARSCADRLAELSASKQKWDEAIAYRKAILELVPGDPSAQRALAETYHQAGHKAEAINALTTLLSNNPTDSDAAYLMGDIHRQSGDLDGARRIFNGILEVHAHHFHARLALAEMAWEAGEFEPAWMHLQEAIAVKPQDERAVSLYRKLTLAFAERAQGESDFAAAIQWWQLAWQQDKSEIELLRKIARAQVTIGHLSGAAETYGRILDADPKDLETAHILADIHRQRGDLRSAEGPLLRIVALDPRHLPSLRALMILARDRGNPPEALKRAYDLLDVEPQNTEALMLLAWSHEQMMERRAALDVCKDIVAIDPQHAEAYHVMGRLARDLGDLDLAKKAMTSAIYFQPRAPYYHTMGTIYQALGQEDEALAAFGQALVLDPEYAEAHADLGLGLLRQQKPDKARPHLQRAHSLLPPETERSMMLQCALDLIG